MEHDKYASYLLDLGSIIKDEAKESKMKAKRNSKKIEGAFYDGNCSAYHRFVSLMRQQAKIFDIPLAELSLDDFDPDKELL